MGFVLCLSLPDFQEGFSHKIKVAYIRFKLTLTQL